MRAPRPNDAITSPRSPGRGLRILIVEDHDDSATSMALLLCLRGYEVTVTRNGRDGLAAARTDKPDVVLLDLGLPGMSGYEVGRQLALDRPNKTPLIIAVTGYGQETDRRRSAEAGIDLHLVKPVDPSQLENLLRQFQRLIHD